MAVIEKSGTSPDPLERVSHVAGRIAALSDAHDRLGSEHAINEHVDKMKANPALCERIENGELDPRQVAESVLRENVRLAEIHYQQTLGIWPIAEAGSTS